MKKYLFTIALMLCSFLAGAQTNLLRITVGDKSIDVISTMSVDQGITRVAYSSPEGLEYFNAEVNETWDRVGDAHLINDLPFERLTDDIEQARTWAQCVMNQINSCNKRFWCELLCGHGVHPTCVIKWGIQCLANAARIEIIE